MLRRELRARLRAWRNPYDLAARSRHRCAGRAADSRADTTHANRGEFAAGPNLVPAARELAHTWLGGLVCDRCRRTRYAAGDSNDETGRVVGNARRPR